MNFFNSKPSFISKAIKSSSSLPLEDGSRIAVIGGGPSGSFFSYFLLEMADRIGLKLHVDIFEPRDYNQPGPVGCNMCGGVLYESLVESLAVEGINLPVNVVRRGIEYNMLHLETGSIRIQTPLLEKRIATTFRGIGPRGLMEFSREGLDSYLMNMAVNKGARHIRCRVDDFQRSAPPGSVDPNTEMITIKMPDGRYQPYDLVAVTAGVNTAALKKFHAMDFGYEPPQTAKLLVREYYLGDLDVSKYIGPVFHAFMLDIPGLDYGAIIPKSDYLTVCLLSSHGDLHPDAMDTFLNHPSVKSLLPPDFPVEHFSCWCGPRINIQGSEQPYGDRIVFIGDSGVSRLYKDGLGSSYRTAKTAARTAIFQGVSADDFKQYYLPYCQKVEADNLIGKHLFKVVSKLQKLNFIRNAVLQMISREQQGNASVEHGMSTVVWDMLTGGAPYKEVLLRTMHPLFLIRFLGNILLSFFKPFTPSKVDLLKDAILIPSDQKGALLIQQDMREYTMNQAALGKVYQAGEIIFRQGDPGDCMLVIQEGQVEVIGELNGQEIRLAVSGAGEVIGEMAIIEQQVRSATVRAVSKARVLTVDEKTFMRYVHQDPSLAYQLLKMMSNRIRKLNAEIAHLTVNHRNDQENK